MNWRLPEILFCRPFFFGEHLRLCPWSLALASSIPVLGFERFCPRKGCPWPWIFFCVLGLGLEPCVLDSTSVEDLFLRSPEKKIGKTFFLFFLESTCVYVLCLGLQPGVLDSTSVNYFSKLLIKTLLPSFYCNEQIVTVNCNLTHLSMI